IIWIVEKTYEIYFCTVKKILMWKIVVVLINYNDAIHIFCGKLNYALVYNHLSTFLWITL
ncbi:MAG: hypothetical protein RR659_03985, partial [Bacilli bacterium]